VIIASYSVLTEQEAQRHSPVLVYVDEKNSVKRVGSQIAQAL
jgi:aspartate 1-decarboxylase